jgi:hypothetical protein
MKIDRPGSVNSTSGARRGEKAGSTRPGEFQRYLDKTPGPTSVSAGNAIGSVDALLAAQSVDAADDQGRRKATKRGEDILDRLDELRHGLLTGTLTMAQVQSLSTMVRTQRASVADPRLHQILDEIELRAEVELAKFAAGSSS